MTAVLDGLPYHFDPNFAPPDILELLAAWLGVDLDETQDIKHQREMVLRSSELSRKRGTVGGMPVPDWSKPSLGALALGVLATPLILIVSERIEQPGEDEPELIEHGIAL